MMRFVGATAAVRRANGFEHVRFLCTKQDFDISMELYSFEKEALKRAAGGKNWASSEYGSQYKDLFDVARPIAGPKLGLREVFKPRAKKPVAPASASTRGNWLLCLEEILKSKIHS